jgi:hypothetical protein
MEGNISLIGKSRSASPPEHLGFKLTRLTADRSSFETGDRDIPANRPAPQSRHRHYNLDLPSPQRPTKSPTRPSEHSTTASAVSFQPTPSCSLSSTARPSRPSSATSAPTLSTAAPRSKTTSLSGSSGRLASSTGMRRGRRRQSVRCFRGLGSWIW